MAQLNLCLAILRTGSSRPQLRPAAAVVAAETLVTNGVPIHEINDSVGRKSTTRVTETVYGHVIVPAIQGGATVMDNVFDDSEDG